jgi:hypothetical protein
VQVNDLTEKSREIERQARAGWSGVFSQVASLAQEIDQFLLALSMWLDAGAPTR